MSTSSLVAGHLCHEGGSESTALRGEAASDYCQLSLPSPSEGQHRTSE